MKKTEQTTGITQQTKARNAFQNKNFLRPCLKVSREGLFLVRGGGGFCLEELIYAWIMLRRAACCSWAEFIKWLYLYFLIGFWVANIWLCTVSLKQTGSLRHTWSTVAFRKKMDFCLVLSVLTSDASLSYRNRNTFSQKSVGGVINKGIMFTDSLGLSATFQKIIRNECFFQYISKYRLHWKSKGTVCMYMGRPMQNCLQWGSSVYQLLFYWRWFEQSPVWLSSHEPEIASHPSARLPFPPQIPSAGKG